MKKLIFLLLLIIPVACIGQGEWSTRQDFNQGIQIVGGVTVSNVYISAGDTIVTIAGKDFILSDIRLKLFIADTAAMLLTYIDRSDTSVMLANYALLSEIDHDAILNTHNLTTDIDHDQLTNFADNEHRIWEITGAQDIHDDRIQESSVTQHEAAIDHDALTNFLASEHVIYVGGSGITRDGTDIDLGGALDAPTTITGTEVNDFNISMTDAGDRSGILGFDAANWWLSMRAYTGDDHTGDSSIVAVDSTIVTMAQYDGAAVKSIVIDTNKFVFKDTDNGKGPEGFADYSSGVTPLSYTQKVYQDEHLGGQDVNAILYGPGDAQHNAIVIWDTTEGADEYTLKQSVPLAETAGVVLEAFDTIIWSNTSENIIIDDLPVAAVVWEIHVFIETSFNGSGTDYLDVGITGEADKFANDFSLGDLPDKFYGLSAIPYRTAGTTDFTFQYTDGGADASAGLALIYIKYTIE